MSSEVWRSKHSFNILLGKFSPCNRFIMFLGWWSIYLLNANSLSFTWHQFTVWQILSLIINSNFQWRLPEPKLCKSLWDRIQSKLYYFLKIFSCTCSVTEQTQWNVLLLSLSSNHKKKLCCFRKIFFCCLLSLIIFFAK